MVGACWEGLTALAHIPLWGMGMALCSQRKQASEQLWEGRVLAETLESSFLELVLTIAQLHFHVAGD